MTDWNAWYDEEIRPTLNEKVIKRPTRVSGGTSYFPSDAQATPDWEDGFDSRPTEIPAREEQRPLSKLEIIVFAAFLVAVVALILFLGWLFSEWLRGVVTFVTMSGTP